MPYSVKADGVACRDCGEDEIYMDVKEEPSLYKVGAFCQGCDRDYGVLDYVSQSEVDHQDEGWEYAEEFIQQYFE